MGEYDSSRTRVRPFFEQLISRDKTGETWLPRLLQLSPEGDGLGDVLDRPGRLVGKLNYEKPIPPPEDFLRWLLSNPQEMTWPKGGTEEYEERTQRFREMMMLRGEWVNRFETRRQAINDGLFELDLSGAKGSRQKWWAFEGFATINCYLETDRLKIYVEGKRTDKLSPKTEWYPHRNQLLRELEAAEVDAAGKEFACLMIVEDPAPPLSGEVIEKSLPHLTAEERSRLLNHYLGCVTWRDACEATGVDYDGLPHTV